MHALLVLLPVALFLALLLYIGYRANRRLNTSASFQSEYFLGSRSLGGVVLAMTLVATYGSVSTYVSGPGLAWGYGLGWVVFAAPQIITGYVGPQPPDQTHDYTLRVYALDTALPLKNGYWLNEFIHAAHGHILDHGKIDLPSRA